jgi:hypothetical protein
LSFKFELKSADIAISQCAFNDGLNFAIEAFQSVELHSEIKILLKVLDVAIVNINSYKDNIITSDDMKKNYIVNILNKYKDLKVLVEFKLDDLQQVENVRKEKKENEQQQQQQDEEEAEFGKCNTNSIEIKQVGCSIDQQQQLKLQLKKENVLEEDIFLNNEMIEKKQENKSCLRVVSEKKSSNENKLENKKQIINKNDFTSTHNIFENNIIIFSSDLTSERQIVNKKILKEEALNKNIKSYKYISFSNRALNFHISKNNKEIKPTILKTIQSTKHNKRISNKKKNPISSLQSPRCEFNLERNNNEFNFDNTNIFNFDMNKATHNEIKIINKQKNSVNIECFCLIM